MTLAIILIAVLVPFAFLAAIVGMAQGRLTALRNGARNAYRRVDEQLARRHGLVRDHLEGRGGSPEADSVAKALERAEAARSTIETALEDHPSAEALIGAEAELGAALEALPPADDGQVGDRLAFACEIYNDTVFRYTEFRSRFFPRFTAKLFGFPEIEKVSFASAPPPASEGGE